MSANYTWNGVIARPLMPASGQTVNGERFAIPRGASTMTMHIPALAGVATTVKLQSLNPDIAADGTETWADLLTFIEAAPEGTALDAFAESTTVVLHYAVFGAGMLRFVASADQSAAPVRIPVVFGF